MWIPVLLFASFSSLQTDHEFLNEHIKDSICSISIAAQITSSKFTRYRVSILEDEKEPQRYMMTMVAQQHEYAY